MASGLFVETSVANNSPSQDSSQTHDHFQSKTPSLFFLGNFTARTVVKRHTRCLAIGWFSNKTGTSDDEGGREGGIVWILLLFDQNYLGICSARAVVKRQRLLCLATSALCHCQTWPFRILSAPTWFLVGLYLMISLVTHCFWSSNFNGSSWFIVSLINDRV